MRLSPHFTLEEFRVSSRFPQLAAGIEFSGHDVHKCFLLARTVLEPIRERLGGPIIITSGKRSLELNRAVSGSPTSDHLFQGFSAAVDFSLPEEWRGRLAEAPGVLPKAAFGQFILYLEADGRRPRFVHVSLPTMKHQGETMIWVRGRPRPEAV